MTEEMLPLARRAVECKGWRWMPGMADQFGRRVMQVYPDELGFRWSHLLENNVVRDADALPDLTDPATLGCLLALVREAWGDDRAYLCDFEGYDSVEWGVVSKIWDEKRNEEGPKAWFSCLLGDADTEAGALVAALEAAP